MNLLQSLGNIFACFSSSPAPAPAETAPEQPVVAEEPAPRPELRDADGRLTMTTANFSPLIQMFQGGSLKIQHALTAAAKERTSENLYNVAFELFCILSPYQIHFIAGGENDWLDNVAKMREIAREAADASDASADACNLAGIVCAREWTFGDFEIECCSMETGQPVPVEPPLAISVPSDLPDALKWFRKGAAMGCEVCAQNTELALTCLEKQAAQAATPPQQSPQEPPRPAAP